MNVFSNLAVLAFTASAAIAEEHNFTTVIVVDTGVNSITVEADDGQQAILNLLDKNTFHLDFDESWPIVTPEFVKLGDVYFVTNNFFTDNLYDNVPWPSRDYATQVINFGAQLYTQNNGDYIPLGQMAVAADISMYELTRSWERPDQALCVTAFSGARGLAHRGTLLDINESFPSIEAKEFCLHTVATYNNEHGTSFSWPTSLVP